MIESWLMTFYILLNGFCPRWTMIAASLSLSLARILPTLRCAPDSIAYQDCSVYTECNCKRFIGCFTHPISSHSPFSNPQKETEWKGICSPHRMRENIGRTDALSSPLSSVGIIDFAGVVIFPSEHGYKGHDWEPILSVSRIARSPLRLFHSYRRSLLSLPMK